jgi:5-methylcytosine-specific restriction endonuclease McrA
MSLFEYTYWKDDDSSVTGKVTAKTKEEARARLDKKYPRYRFGKMCELPAEPGPTANHARPTTKLSRLLYLQHGKCFFCDQLLKDDEASIEHLVAKSRGGLSDETNEVVCCSNLNSMFGDMTIKEKFEFVLKSAGTFSCPRKKEK